MTYHFRYSVSEVGVTSKTLREKTNLIPLITSVEFL